MQIWMKHDKHGVLPVYEENEAKRNELSGWVRFIPEWQKPKNVVESKVAELPKVADVADSAPEPVKRGRPRKVLIDGNGSDKD